VTDHPHSEESLPNVQTELSLMQLHSVSLCPITSHRREKISNSPTAALIEEVVDCDGVSLLFSKLNKTSDLICSL